MHKLWCRRTLRIFESMRQVQRTTEPEQQSDEATKLSEEAAQPVKHRSIDAPATPVAPEEETEDMQTEEVGGDASEAETDVQKNDGVW